ncbi:unnamed protein product [Aphanomyces euteiches]
MENDLIDALGTIPWDDALAPQFDVDEFLDEESLSTAPAALADESTSKSESTTSTSTSPRPDKLTSSSTSGPKSINQSRKRMREEIAYLRSKVDELEAHLKVLQQIKTLEVTFVDETPWQKTANDMRIAKKAALHVNSKLRHELQEQIEFGKALQTLMAKRPRLTMLPSLDGDQWQILKLVKNPQLRQQAIHEICERQYQLTQVALVEGGIFDRVGEFEAYTPRLAKTNADLVVQAAYCTTKQFDFQVMSEMAWKVFEGCLGAKNSNLTSHTLKTLDQNAVYFRKEKHWNDLLNQANCLYKRYREPHRDVIVCRTILEDEEIPFHPGALVMNKSAWLVLEKLDGGKACRLKYFQKSTLPMVQSNFGTKNLVDRAETSRYYRVGNVTNAVLLSLQNLIRDVSVTLRLLVDNYTGNIDDTFELVNRLLVQG